MSFKSKDLILYFYDQCEDPEYYICKNTKCGSKQKQKTNTGYTNLKNHLRSCVGANFEDIYKEILQSCKDKGRLDSYGFINRRETEVYEILSWIIRRNHPLSEVDDEETREMLKTKPISSKTLRKYILALTPHVEKVISADLPDKFGLMFDGWTSGTVKWSAQRTIAGYRAVVK